MRTRPSPRCGGSGPALPCPLSPGQPPPTPQQQPRFTSASRRGRCGCRSAGPPSEAGGSQGRREGGRAPTRTCVSSSRLLPLGSGSSLAASAAPSAPPTQPLLPRPHLAARVAFIGAPGSPHPLARATSCRGTPPPSGARAPAAAGLGPGDICSRPSCGGKSVARGRVLPAIAQTARHQVGPVCPGEPTSRRPRGPAGPC